MTLLSQHLDKVTLMGGNIKHQTPSDMPQDAFDAIQFDYSFMISIYGTNHQFGECE
jgi:hypothetical protein